MTQGIRRWLLRNPYTAISLVFLALLIFGWRVLGWDETEFGFLLLVYFVITLGVRLDEISRTLGAKDPEPESPGPETVLSHLREINVLLKKIHAAQKTAPPRESGEAPKDR
jgi:hypothetical protein